MKNDYSRYNFWTEKNDGKLKYYMVLKGRKIQVPKEVFLVCQNSYRKMLRDSENDQYVYNFTDLSQAEKYQIDKQSDEDRLNQLYRKYEIDKALDKLTVHERYLIEEIYFNGCSERVLAEKIGIPEKTLNNHKRKILQKLRKIMAENWK